MTTGAGEPGAPSFETFWRHAHELRAMHRELRSRHGDDPAEIIGAEANEPSVLELAIEIALHDSEQNGELASALARARALPDARSRGDAVDQAWAMAGEAIVWEAGPRVAPTVRRALERRGVARSALEHMPERP